MKRFLSSFTKTIRACAALCVPAIWASQAAAEVPVKLSVELDQPVLLAGGRQHAVIKVSLDGMRLPAATRPPVNLALVIDRSGSMSGDKIEYAKAAAIEAVRRLGRDDLFSLVIFDHEVQTIVPASHVVDPARIEALIRGIEPRGNTAIYAGVTQGTAELRRNADDRRYTSRVLLLSDGQANVGPSSPDDFARLGRALGGEGFSVTTVGVGMDYSEDLMTRLATRSDGNTYFVASSRDLPHIFDAELGDVLNVVARQVVVTLDFPANVHPIAFVGREGSINGRRAEFTLNQIYGGQQKFALVEVEVDARPAGERCEIARARLTCADTAGHAGLSVATRSEARFSRDQQEVIAAANRQVQSDYALNLTAVTKDRAVELVDANRQADAANLLRARNAELQKIAQLYSNGAVQSIVASNSIEAKRLESEGLSLYMRKTYRTSNAQVTAQQSNDATTK